MIKNILVLPDGTEISSGAGYGIKESFSHRDVNDSDELLLGSVCSNEVSFTIYDVGGTLTLGAGDEITLYREQNGVRVKKGVYRLEKPTRPTANTMKITGYDRVVKLDKDLTDWINSLSGWPYNILTFARMVCEECGLSFVTTEAPNMDFPVYQFAKTGVTGRKIMRWLAEICCRFCRANDNGEIEFSWYTPSGVTIRPTGNRYYFQGALAFEAYKVAPVEAVQIQMADSSAGALWPAVDSGLNSYIISGNAVVNSRVTEELLPYLDVIKEQLAGVTYTPCKLSVPACLDIDAGNTVDIIDKNGVQITAYVMSKTTSGQKDTIECTGSPRRDSSRVMNTRSPSADQAFSDAFAGLTQAQIFNKLTNNGAIQGIYVQDGKWYINAEFAKIVNLIAEHVKSVKGDQTVEIDGGKLEFYIAGVLYAALNSDPIFGGASLGMYSYKDGATSVTAEMHGSGFYAESNEEVFGITNVVQIGIDPKTGVPYADLPRLNDMQVYWEPNGDGTFTLKGMEV